MDVKVGMTTTEGQFTEFVVEGESVAEVREFVLDFFKGVIDTRKVLFIGPRKSTHRILATVQLDKPIGEVTLYLELEAASLREADADARAYVYDKFADLIVGRSIVVRQAP